VTNPGARIARRSNGRLAPQASSTVQPSISGNAARVPSAKLSWPPRTPDMRSGERSSPPACERERRDTLDECADPVDGRDVAIASVGHGASSASADTLRAGFSVRLPDSHRDGG
jgi:hypothetical protein